MLCYAMLCYAMAMLCYAMLWYAMVWYGMVILASIIIPQIFSSLRFVLQILFSINHISSQKMQPMLSSTNLQNIKQ